MWSDSEWLAALAAEDESVGRDLWRELYLCEPNSFNWSIHQLNRLRPPALFVMEGREIDRNGGHRFVEEHQRRHVRIVSASSFQYDGASLIRGALWTDFDVDHAVWEMISKHWSFTRESEFKDRVSTLCRMIQDRTGQRPSLLENFKEWENERAKAKATVQAARDVRGKTG